VKGLSSDTVQGFERLQLNQAKIKMTMFVISQVYIYFSIHGMLQNQNQLEVAGGKFFTAFHGKDLEFFTDIGLDANMAKADIANGLERHLKYLSKHHNNSNAQNDFFGDYQAVLATGVIIICFFMQTYSILCNQDEKRLLDLCQLHETQQFENIWHKTVSKNMQCGVVLFNFRQKVISVNKKFREIVGIGETKEKKAPSSKVDSNGKQVKTQASSKVTVVNTQKSMGNQLVSLSNYFNQHLFWNKHKWPSWMGDHSEDSFVANKYTFYDYSSKNKGLLKNLNLYQNATHIYEEIDWSQIIVKRKSRKSIINTMSGIQDSLEKKIEENEDEQMESQGLIASDSCPNLLQQPQKSQKSSPTHQTLKGIQINSI